MSDDKRAGRLGRGLSALLGEVEDEATASAAPAGGELASGMRQVPIERLHRGRFQPRRQFDAEQIESLAESIRAQGVLQPLLVRPHPERLGEFEILAGERRWRAAQAARLAELPVLVREISNREALEIALVENVQRQDLNPIEEARGYQRLIAEFSHTQEEIARVTGKSRPHIANMIRLLSLPEEILLLVEEGKLTPGHARPLIGHKDAVELAREAVRWDMTVRQIENMMRSLNRRLPEAVAAAAAPADPNLKDLEQQIEILTGMKTRIVDRSGRGTVTFSYATLDQLGNLLERIRRS